MDISELENPRGVVISVGGQTPNNLAVGLHRCGRGRSWVQLMPAVAVDVAVSVAAVAASGGSNNRCGFVAAFLLH